MEVVDCVLILILVITLLSGIPLYFYIGKKIHEQICFISKLNDAESLQLELAHSFTGYLFCTNVIQSPKSNQATLKIMQIIKNNDNKLKHLTCDGSLIYASAPHLLSTLKIYDFPVVVALIKGQVFEKKCINFYATDYEETVKVFIHKTQPEETTA